MMIKVKLDSKGIGQFLRSKPVANMIEEVTDEIASAASDGGHVETHQVTTDRAAGRVFISPASEQAAGGALSRAAASVGLEIKGH